MMSAWLWLFLASMMSVGGNVLIKRSSQVPQGDTIAFLAIFGCGAALFGIGLICYQRALTTLPLSVAYPILVGAILTLASMIAVLWFGERMTAGTIGGMVLIFAGIVLLTMQPHAY